jgi:hypothetical protein
MSKINDNGKRGKQNAASAASSRKPLILLAARVRGNSL